MDKKYKNVKNWYNNNIEIYLKSGDILMARKLNKFLKYVPKSGYVIDLGSGTGRDVEYFAKKGVNAIGIDFSKEMIKYAKNNRELGIFRYGDVRGTKVNFKKNTIDGVWDSSSLFTHSEINDIYKVLKKINSWLKNGGVFGSIEMKKNKLDSNKFQKDFIFNKFSSDEIILLLKLNNLEPIYFQEFKAHGREWFFVLSIKS